MFLWLQVWTTDRCWLHDSMFCLAGPCAVSERWQVVSACLRQTISINDWMW